MGYLIRQNPEDGVIGNLISHSPDRIAWKGGVKG